VALRRWWQIDSTFAAFHLTPHPDVASHDPVAAASRGMAPAYQWRGHSALSLGPRAQADLLLFYVGSLDETAIPSYTRADARVEWNFTRRLTLTAQGQNLLGPSHAEFASDTILVATRIPRNGSLRLTWRF
jgi:outer membrane receptor protein involved in Fe transport